MRTLFHALQNRPGSKALVLRALTVALVWATATVARGEVLDSSYGGFSTLTVIETTRGRAETYEAFVNDIGRWWNPDHTVSGTSAALYLDARPMGCFCESLGTGAGLVHLTVTFVNPGVLLRLSGGLGPLGLLGTTGNMTVEFEDLDEGTRVTLQYVVGGYAPDGLASLAGPVDAVLADQLHRFSVYLGEGNLPDE